MEEGQEGRETKKGRGREHTLGGLKGESVGNCMFKKKTPPAYGLSGYQKKR